MLVEWPIKNILANIKIVFNLKFKKKYKKDQN